MIPFPLGNASTFCALLVVSLLDSFMIFNNQKQERVHTHTVCAHALSQVRCLLGFITVFQTATLNTILILAGGIHSPTQYAFVCWFKHAPIRGDLLEAAGCVRLVYDTASSGHTRFV